MPTYEYECKSCKRRFEVFQMMSEAANKRCPKCKKPARRLIGSGAGIMFKGSGFYQTDYKKSRAPQSETKAGTKAETKSETKAETKAAAESKPAEKKNK